MISRVFNFFKRQSSNFKVLLVQGIVIGHGTREGIVHTLTQQYTSLYIVALGASKVELGLIQSIGTATRIAISAPIGRVIDKVSLKKITFVGMMLEFLSVLMYALARNWYMIVPAIMLLSLSTPTWGTAYHIFATDSLGDSDRATGFSVLSTISMVPTLVMPLLAAYIIETFGGLKSEGIRPLFYIQFIILVPVSLWVYWNLKEPKRERPKDTPNLLQSLKKFVVLEKGLRMWLLVGVFDSFAMFAFTFLNVYAVEVKGATTSIIALMGVASNLASVLFMIPFGRLADRIGRKPCLYIGLIPTWAWILLLIYSPSPQWLILSSVFGGAYIANWFLWNAITMELVPEHLRGSYEGTLAFISGISSMVATTVGGFLWETVGPSSIFLITLAFETMAIALTSTIPETLIKESNP